MTKTPASWLAAAALAVVATPSVHAAPAAKAAPAKKTMTKKKVAPKSKGPKPGTATSAAPPAAPKMPTYVRHTVHVPGYAFTPVSAPDKWRAGLEMSRTAEKGRLVTVAAALNFPLVDAKMVFGDVQCKMRALDKMTYDIRVKDARFDSEYMYDRARKHGQLVDVGPTWVTAKPKGQLKLDPDAKAYHLEVSLRVASKPGQTGWLPAGNGLYGCRVNYFIRE